MDHYIRQLQVDKQITIDNYKKSLEIKTEQQKALEYILLDLELNPNNIADIACGGTSYFLSKLYPNSNFYLSDLNQEAISFIKENIPNPHFTYGVDGIYNIEKSTDIFDLVLCWQTLSWLENPEDGLNELIRICKPGGHIIISSLFNLDFDVDISSRVTDHTRESSKFGESLIYNTLSKKTILKWIESKVQNIKFERFELNMKIDIKNFGLGTFTEELKYGKYIQISGGMLLNWAILIIKK